MSVVARERSNWWVVIALAVLCLVPLAKGTMLVSAPYGDSHDGRNGSTWAAGAEALRSDPSAVDSARSASTGSVYANHPPGILVAVATAEVVGGRQAERRSRRDGPRPLADDRA